MFNPLNDPFLMIKAGNALMQTAAVFFLVGLTKLLVGVVGHMVWDSAVMIFG